MMPALIDTSLWIDFSRPRSPRKLKQFIAPYIVDPNACLAEPVIFETLRHATTVEAKVLAQHFQTMPTLGTPAGLWTEATDLGQICRQKGLTIQSLDLLIAVIAIEHGAEVVTFDDDFQKIANVSGLMVRLLTRPTP